jgi:hypothetical protein
VRFAEDDAPDDEPRQRNVGQAGGLDRRVAGHDPEGSEDVEKGPRESQGDREALEGRASRWSFAGPSESCPFAEHQRAPSL